MKKLITFILAVVVLTVTVVGCSPKSETEVNKDKEQVQQKESKDKKEDKKDDVEKTEKQELNISVFQGGYGREYWDEVAKRFEAANPGVTVNVNANPKIAETIRTDILAGNSPDFVFLQSEEPSGVTNTLIADKQIEDITDVITTIEDRFIPGTFDNPKLKPYGDDKIFLSPFSFSTLGLWYNEDYFTKNNIKLPKTWDDFFALQNTVTDRALFTYQGIYTGYLVCVIPATIASASANGENVLNRIMSYDVTALDDPDFRNALDILAKMYSSGALMEGTAGLDHTQSQSEFLLGKALFIPCGAWIANEMAEAPREDNFKYGMMAPPTAIEGAYPYISTKVEEMYIPKAAKNKALAKKFLAFLYTDENLQLQAELTQGLPPVNGAASIIEPFVDPAVTASIRVLEGDVKGLSSSFAVVGNMAVNAKEAFWNEMASIITGAKTPEEAVEALRPIFEEAASKLE